MYTLIIFGVIFIVLLIWSFLSSNVGLFVFDFILGFIFAMGFFFFSDVIGDNITKSDVDYELNVVSMKDNTLGIGYYYLFGGSYQENQYYFFYKRLDDGTYQLDKIPAEYAYIHEENRTDGLIKVDATRIKRNGGFTNWQFMLFGYERVQVNRYDVFIPSGSIKREFNLDSLK